MGSAEGSPEGSQSGLPEGSQGGSLGAPLGGSIGGVLVGLPDPPDFFRGVSGGVAGGVLGDGSGVELVEVKNTCPFRMISGVRGVKGRRWAEYVVDDRGPRDQVSKSY